MKRNLKDIGPQPNVKASEQLACNDKAMQILNTIERQMDLTLAELENEKNPGLADMLHKRFKMYADAYHRHAKSLGLLTTKQAKKGLRDRFASIPPVSTTKGVLSLIQKSESNHVKKPKRNRAS